MRRLGLFAAVAVNACSASIPAQAAAPPRSAPVQSPRRTKVQIAGQTLRCGASSVTLPSRWSWREIGTGRYIGASRDPDAGGILVAETEADLFEEWARLHAHVAKPDDPALQGSFPAELESSEGTTSLVYGHGRAFILRVRRVGRCWWLGLEPNRACAGVGALALLEDLDASASVIDQPSMRAPTHPGRDAVIEDLELLRGLSRALTCWGRPSMPTAPDAVDRLRDCPRIDR